MQKERNIDPKIFVSDSSWESEVNTILQSQPGGSVSYTQRFFQKEDEEKESLFKKVFARLQPKRPQPMGGPPVEGLVSLLSQGIDILLNNPVVDHKLFKLLELYALYDFAKTKVGKRGGKILQLITDYATGEPGDFPPEDKSITFIWSANLSKDEFDKSVREIPKVRDYIKKKLEEEKPRDINHVECHYSRYNDDWQILWVEKGSGNNEKSEAVVPLR